PLVNCEPSAGRSFHCLQATSHALQPMHTVVSVKKPILRAPARWIASSVGAAVVALTNRPLALLPAGSRRVGRPGPAPRRRPLARHPLGAQSKAGGAGPHARRT